MDIAATVLLSSGNIAHVDFIWHNSRCLTKIRFERKETEEDLAETEAGIQETFRFLGVGAKRLLKTDTEENPEEARRDAARFLYGGAGSN